MINEIDNFIKENEKVIKINELMKYVCLNNEILEKFKNNSKYYLWLLEKHNKKYK